MQENNLIEEFSGFEVTPCENISATDEKNKLELTDFQKARMSAFVSHIPELTAANTLANAYTVKIPKDITGELMKYKTGGLGTPIIGENGKVVGHASLHGLAQSALIMNAFSVMAIATGQYYLKAISGEFKMLNQKIDSILEFLYGEKKSELVSEICFVQHACKNFSAIMEHDGQRIATITNLQAAQKTAVKDIEFYISDMNKKVEPKFKNYSEFKGVAEKIFKLKDSLEMAIQLYAMSNIMEVSYSRNYDENYISDIKDTTIYYINKCEKQMIYVFGRLAAAYNNFQGNKINKINNDYIGKNINKVIDSLNVGEDSKLNSIVKLTFDDMSKDYVFRIDKSGNVYKVA